MRVTALMAIMLISGTFPSRALTPRGGVGRSASVSEQAAFDVASVKPSDPSSTGFSMRPKPDDFVMNGATLKFLIQYAYDIHDFQVEGGPGWIRSARFDVKGKMDHPVGATQDRDTGDKLLQLRLKALLTERFRLRVHSTTKELPVYGLVVAKGGSKLQTGKTNEGYSVSAGMYKCSYSSMSDLAWLLSGSLDRIVLDETKLNGRFAFTLKWTPDESTNSNATLPGLFTAIQDQLGLKLVPQKEPVPVVIVDAVDRPLKN